MNRLNIRLTPTLLSSAFILLLASCKSENKKPPAHEAATEPMEVQTQGDRTVIFTPGKAGGIIQDTFSNTVTVSAIDKSTRQITLKADDGSTATFVAGPEIRNFDQVSVGDKVTATIFEQMYVYVRDDKVDPQVTYSAALARAPKGAKPGAMVAESYAITAKVKSIDPDGRLCTLEFKDGRTRLVPIRPDIDVSKYNPGDTVVIEVTQALSIVAENP